MREEKALMLTSKDYEEQVQQFIINKIKDWSFEEESMDEFTKSLIC